jgi:hypothetical protein
MPESRVIQPAQVLALSLIALGATTLHGIRSSAPASAGAQLIAGGTTGATGGTSLASARERAARVCTATRTRGRHATGCAEQ